ncbi:cadmium resistance transporter, partial [Streptococcus pneumoniae]
MGLFFYTIGSIISIGDLPTTNIIEPDNLGIYIPYFASLDWSQTLVALLVFVIGIIIFCEISRVLSSIPLIFETIEKYERIIVPLVFILLGLYIMYENGTIETFLIV